MYVQHDNIRGNKLADKTLKVHHDSKDQNVDLYDDMYDDMYADNSDAADAVSNVEEYNLATNQQNGNAIAEVHYQDEESPSHRSQSLDSQLRDLKDGYAKVGLGSTIIPEFNLLIDM